MTANSREGILRLDRQRIQEEIGQMRYEWPQAEQSNYVSEPGRPSAGIWSSAMGTVLAAGYSLVQLLRAGAPSGESNFKRQIL